MSIVANVNYVVLKQISTQVIAAEFTVIRQGEEVDCCLVVFKGAVLQIQRTSSVVANIHKISGAVILE